MPKLRSWNIEPEMSLFIFLLSHFVPVNIYFLFGLVHTLERLLIQREFKATEVHNPLALADLSVTEHVIFEKNCLRKDESIRVTNAFSEDMLFEGKFGIDLRFQDLGVSIKSSISPLMRYKSSLMKERASVSMNPRNSKLVRLSSFTGNKPEATDQSHQGALSGQFLNISNNSHNISEIIYPNDHFNFKNNDLDKSNLPLRDPRDESARFQDMILSDEENLVWEKKPIDQNFKSLQILNSSNKSIPDWKTNPDYIGSPLGNENSSASRPTIKLVDFSSSDVSKYYY
jgi:hypothetical protein